MVLGLRPHATQGTRPPNNYNALLTIKNIERHVCNAGKAYLRVRGVGVAWGLLNYFLNPPAMVYQIIRENIIYTQPGPRDATHKLTYDPKT
jgi:hypothetical protein